MACQVSRSTSASVSMTASMVAMLGQIMPAPLAMPVRRTVPPDRGTVMLANLGKASVVMNARVKPSASRLPRLSTREGTASRQRSILSWSPMTPVDMGMISCGASPVRAATMRRVSRQFSRPSSPVQALAWPELASTARQVPYSRRVCWQTCTGAALKALVVNRPASTAGRSETISPRSSRPAFLKPAAAAPAEKPRGRSLRVSLMGTSFPVMGFREENDEKKAGILPCKIPAVISSNQRCPVFVGTDVQDASFCSSGSRRR